MVHACNRGSSHDTDIQPPHDETMTPHIHTHKTLNITLIKQISQHPTHSTLIQSIQHPDKRNKLH